MAQPGWFNGNLGRAYPFLAGTVGAAVDGPVTVRNLPADAVVDAGFVAGPLSAFESDADVVYLLRVRREGATLYFDFASTAAGLDGVVLTFSRAVSAGRYVQEFAEAAGEEFADSDSLSDVDCEEPALTGFLVTGDLAALLALLPGDGEIAGNPGGYGVLEPARVQNLAGAYVTGVGVANADRTRTESPDGCEAVAYPFETGAIFVQDVCLTGTVLFKAGYNAVVRQDDAAGRILLQAAVGAGEGEPCEEVEAFAGEAPPGGSELLTGGPVCGELLRSLNGLGGPRIDLKAGLGVTIVPDPDNNVIVVDADFTGMVGCYTDTLSETEEVD